MPTYSYRCGNCGHHFDLHQRFDEADPETCPNCGLPQLQRVYKPVGVVFKGSGFYATDNKSRTGLSANGAVSTNGSAPVEGKSGKTPDDKPKGSDAGSTESKPPADSKPDSPPKS